MEHSGKIIPHKIIIRLTAALIEDTTAPIEEVEEVFTEEDEEEEVHSDVSTINFI